jgi:predicted Co/Zn/Cd cation transporter (cation efflux family)
VPQYTRRQQQWKNLSVLSVVLWTLQWIGMTPYLFQKILVRFLQPFFLSGLVLAWMMVVDDPIYLAVLISVITVVLLLLIYRFIRETALLKKKKKKSANDDRG